MKQGRLGYNSSNDRYGLLAYIALGIIVVDQIKSWH